MPAPPSREHFCAPPIWKRYGPKAGAVHNCKVCGARFRVKNGMWVMTKDPRRT